MKLAISLQPKKKWYHSFVPFVVYNFDMNKIHYAWSFSAAKEWQSMYDEDEFGLTFILHWNNIVSVTGLSQ